jgi:uncharacterized protein (DUF1330 family)
MSVLFITVGRLRQDGAPALERYAAGVMPIITASGGEVLSRGLTTETVVGDPEGQPDLVAVIRFPSADAIRHFLSSSRYESHVIDRNEAFEDLRSYIATDLMAS